MYDAEKMEYIQTHIQDLMDGKIQPKIEHEQSPVEVEVGSITPLAGPTYIQNVQTLDQKMETELYDQIVQMDIIELDREEKEYLATAIVDNTYAVTRSGDYGETKVATFCDVRVAFSVVYDMYEYNGGERYKVIYYTGTYVRSDDPQMFCKELSFRHKAFGRMYTSVNNYSVKAYERAKKTISSPTEGGVYEYAISQPGYVEVPPGYSAGQMTYTVKRRPSTYTSEQYINIMFGDIINPFG